MLKTLPKKAYQTLRNGIRWSRQPQYRWLWCLFAAGIYGFILNAPLPGIEGDAKPALGVFAVAAFLWGTNTLPLAVTGIIVLFLIPVSGALSSEQTYAYFGNRAVFFVLGAFILASPIMRSGLSTRLALAVVSRFGRSQQALMAAILLLAASMSFVLSTHAVVAMLFPVILEVVQAAGAQPGGRFGLAAFLSLAWGASIGGMGTLLGGARTPLAIGLLQSTTGQSISFVQWTMWSIPVVFVLLLVAYGLILQIGQGTAVSLKEAHRYLEARSRHLGPISRRESVTALITLLTILLWVFRGEVWGLDTIAFSGVLLCFISQVADWREVEEDVNWGIFIMYGSAIALSAMLRETGTASALAEGLVTWIHAPTLSFIAIVMLTILLTEGMSNAASVAVLMPIALALAAQYGVDPRAMTLGVTVPSGLAFMLPSSAPAIAIVIGSGYVRPFEAFRRGFWLKLSGFLLFLVMAKFYWPLVGLGGI
ncbi:SLC13/DASS family transporter [Lusitaniella coriacea LEGE 07157]|uniref:Sodium-dependent dicarboxylate transporter SdcS n=1 Tax=Lusitaniella coriacea LEGE 07157 TaxID=945747 RepID=A0A8J7DXT3_9CYAN|nr:DASS family sodium-coupled anion symporter [Lusitaniella coriacea]MBE9117158.1 SLC13/DASS family transporter [Lusitaniella coriacea LEGE 07157]